MRPEESGAVFEALPDTAALIDTQGVIVDVNAAWRRFARVNQCSPNYEFIAKNYFEISRGAQGPDSQYALKAEERIRNVTERRVDRIELDYPCHSPLEDRWYQLQAIALPRTDTTLLLHRRIQREEESAQRMKRALETYAAAFHVTGAALWEWDPVNDRILVKRGASTESETVELSTQEWLRRIHPDDRESLEDALLACGAGLDSNLRIECRELDVEGGWRWMVTQGALLMDEDAGRRFVGTQADITHRRERESVLEKAAMHDSLTGLPNRALFMHRLSDALQDKTHEAIGLLFVDLDDFKRVNDNYGHNVGDRVLNQVAQRLLVATRYKDTLARLGGDEFAVLLDGIHSRSQVLAAADRLCKAMEEPLDIDGRRLRVSASVGGCAASTCRVDPAEALRRADAAMYGAKRAGKRGFHYYSVDPFWSQSDLEDGNAQSEPKTYSVS